MINNPLLFITDNEIPFPSAKLIIHNPTIKELGMISEESYRTAYQIIVNIPKQLKSQGNLDLNDKEDFDIFIEVINHKDENREHFLKFFSLIFPRYSLRIREKDIQLMETTENGNQQYFIDFTNFQEFQEIISQMFSLEYVEMKNAEYNPADGRAAKIAEKLKNRKKQKQDEGSISAKNMSVYRRYASILSIGMAIDLNTILNYTVLQLEIQFKRFTLWTKNETYTKWKLAGAKSEDLGELEDWMMEI